MFGLGKKRSKLGKWIDKKGIKQEDLYKKSSVSKPTITRYCNEELHTGDINRSTAMKILKALKLLTGEEKKIEDFWA